MEGVMGGVSKEQVDCSKKKEQVESSLRSKLSPIHLEVIDASGECGASFQVEIVCEQFEGKSLLERHKMVNGALADEMKDIHALFITKAQTPQQWKQQQESQTSPPPATATATATATFFATATATATASPTADSPTSTTATTTTATASPTAASPTAATTTPATTTTPA